MVIHPRMRNKVRFSPRHSVPDLFHLPGWINALRVLQQCPYLRSERRQRHSGKHLRDGATTVSDLPVKNAYQPQPLPGSKMSAFVAKYDPAGKLLWCTYLGGNQKSMGLGVAAMPDGGVAVAGLTSSDASGPFPTMNAFQPQNNGQSDYFVTVFDASGNMRYSTYLGGSGLEGGPGTDVFVDDGSNGNNIAVDARAWCMSRGDPLRRRRRRGIQIPRNVQRHPDRPQRWNGCLPHHHRPGQERPILADLLELPRRQPRGTRARRRGERQRKSHHRGRLYQVDRAFPPPPTPTEVTRRRQATSATGS